MPRIPRTVTVIASVLLLHVLVLWAIQTGLLHRVVEVIVPAEILVEIIANPIAESAPQTTPPVPKPVARTTPTQSALVKPAITPQSPPAPLAVAEASPAPLASAVAAMPATPATHPTQSAATTPTNAASKSASQGSASTMEMPSTDADYLNNPKPPYPALSKRLGEQGRVVVHVLIGVEGTASQASIKRSSGYDRLDQAALSTAIKWRYVPGKRGGIPEPMWFDIPFNWMLE